MTKNHFDRMFLGLLLVSPEVVTPVSTNIFNPSLHMIKKLKQKERWANYWLFLASGPFTPLTSCLTPGTLTVGFAGSSQPTIYLKFLKQYFNYFDYPNSDHTFQNDKKYLVETFSG